MRSDKIIGRIHEKGYNLTTFSNAIGMAPRTLKRKLKRGIMGSDEILIAADLLGLDGKSDETNPVPYFFEKWVS